jgi:hypothetical protein
MSRTDVHLPYRVKEQDPYWEREGRYRNVYCGCELCTGRYNRRMNRRRERHAVKQSLRSGDMDPVMAFRYRYWFPNY